MSIINYEKCEKEGFTQSELATMADCGYKWHLTYNLGLRRRGSFSWALVFGDAFHRTLEEMYLKGGEGWSIAAMKFDDDVVLTASEEEEKDYYEALLKIMVEAYVERWSLDFKTFRLEPNGIERVVVAEIMYRNIPLKLTGKIDLHGCFGMSSMKMVGDHKTCSMLNAVNVNGWDFRFQFMFYVWMLQQVDGPDSCRGFMVNAVKKTQLRQKQNESLAQFMHRIGVDMKARPDEYFYRKSLPLTRGAMDNFQQHVLLPKLEKLAMLQDPTTPEHFKAAIVLDKNTDACYKYGTNMPCQFIGICQNGIDSERNNYVIKSCKHSELAE